MDAGNPYGCDICHHNFANEGRLNSHKKRKHPGDYVCIICEISLPSKFELRKHFLTEHPKFCKPNLGMQSKKSQ